MELTGNLEYDNKILDALILAERIDGYMPDVDLELIAKEAIKHDVAIEVGCFLGKSTQCMALAKQLICVDDFNGAVNNKDLPYKKYISVYDEFIKNTANLKNIIVIQASTKDKSATQQFNEESIDFAFIDSCHNYKETKEALVKFFPTIKKGGKIWFHDYEIGFADRDLAIDEFVYENKLVTNRIPKTCILEVIK